ncbi:hypothetical protein C6Q09_24765 [Burkholderia multivorans]|nr:hypothetical protein C6Q09_24765 [Burkholderia multivorans]
MKAAGVPGRSVFERQFETTDGRRALRARRAHPARREFVIFSFSAAARSSGPPAAALHRRQHR